MKGFLFLARVALICNLLFLVCLVLQRTHDFIGNREVDMLVLILGWLLAPFINLAANIGYFNVLIRKKAVNFPAWLAVTNLIFLIMQGYFHFILPK